MNFAVEWLAPVVVLGALVLFLIGPIALVMVLMVALAALVALVALAAAALVSPYLLVRSLRRRLAKPTTRRRTRWIDSPGAIPSRSDESRAILGAVQSLPRQTGRREPVPRSAGVHRGRHGGPAQARDVNVFLD
jgi:hypothetical protein